MNPTATGAKVGNFLTSEATGASHLEVYTNGTLRFNNVVYSLTTRTGSQMVIIHWDVQAIMLAAVECDEVIAVLSWPERE